MRFKPIAFVVERGPPAPSYALAAAAKLDSRMLVMPLLLLDSFDDSSRCYFVKTKLFLRITSGRLLLTAAAGARLGLDYGKEPPVGC